MSSVVRRIGALLLAAVLVALVVIGQRTGESAGLGIMLTGLAGLIVSLGLYTRRYR